MKKIQYMIGFFSVALIAFATIGCGGGINVEYVEGKVTYNGEPVEGASVYFSPAEGSTGKSAFGKTDASGVYKLTAQENTTKGVAKGTTQGEYVVTISKEDGGYDRNLVGKTPEEVADLDRQRNNGTYTPDIVPYENKLPAKYKDPKTSGFTATVKNGKNLDVNFDLVD